MNSSAPASATNTPAGPNGRIAGRFLTWCAHHHLELRQITPGLAGEYIGRLHGSAPTKNQALAALRHLFDALVQRHAVALNPFASVRGLKYSVTVVTDLLNQNVPLEDVQYLAGHASPTTTRVYDWRRRKVTRNIVERVSI